VAVKGRKTRTRTKVERVVVEILMAFLSYLLVLMQVEVWI